MQNTEKGGVALEYVLVTTFAAIATTVALGIMSTIVKKKIGDLSSKFDVSSDFEEFDLFKD